MKQANLILYSLTLTFILISCTSNSNDPDFLKNVEGHYLYTEDETVKVYSKDNILLLDWRGAENIKPSKLNDNTFYVKEMNSKIQFLTNPEDQKQYLVFVPKEKEKQIEYVHAKVSDDFKLPSEYLEEGNYTKALEGYLAIKAKDSLSPILNRRGFRNKGYNYLGRDSIDLAIKIFKINVALHPTKSNPYDNLGEAYLKNKDTVNSLASYKKALEFDSGNRRIKRTIEKLQGKEADKTN
jgi:tetratricopeptide (TPR) repeat protein